MRKGGTITALQPKPRLPPPSSFPFPFHFPFLTRPHLSHPPTHPNLPFNLPRTFMSTSDSCLLDLQIAQTIDHSHQNALLSMTTPVATPIIFDETDPKYVAVQEFETRPDIIKISDYFTTTSFQAIKNKADQVQTPAVVIDADIVAQNYDLLSNTFPYGTIYFAVKANPNVDLTKMLVGKGSSFDIASRYELDRVLSCGLDPLKASYGNTIKKPQDIAYFYEKGVRLFATDSILDLTNIAKKAPGSGFYCRILLEGGADTADWPLSKKFGCSPKMALALMTKGKELGLIPRGVSFHVGSQQKQVDCWPQALTVVSDMYRELQEKHDIKCDLVNLGGGLCANYVVNTEPLAAYEAAITKALNEAFTDETRPTTIIFEPGRSLVGGAGIVVSEVVLASYKGDDVELCPDATNRSAATGKKWIYTDCGVFNGLIETLGEALKYPIVVQQQETDAMTMVSYIPAQEEYAQAVVDLQRAQDVEFQETAETILATQPRVAVVLAGNTCDSADIMYLETQYRFPTAITQGDRVWFLTCGAYTDSYASNNFNGFPPLQCHVINSRDMNQ